MESRPPALPGQAKKPAKTARARKPAPRPASPAAAKACGGCGALPGAGESYRRGRCKRCYDQWVRAKPVGLGACCLACGERRRDVLRHFELHRSWVVLCHNCTARAEALATLPRSAHGLCLSLGRDRRHGDRRADAVTGGTRRIRQGSERRQVERRLGLRDAIDATDLAVMEVELEADAASPGELADPSDVPITDVHRRLDPSEL